LPNLPPSPSLKVQAATMGIEVFGYSVGVAEGISKRAKKPRFVQLLCVEDYRY
jgi:hypothetical protein